MDECRRGGKKQSINPEEKCHLIPRTSILMAICQGICLATRCLPAHVMFEGVFLSTFTLIVMEECCGQAPVKKIEDDGMKSCGEETSSLIATRCLEFPSNASTVAKKELDSEPSLERCSVRIWCGVSKFGGWHRRPATRIYFAHAVHLS